MNGDEYDLRDNMGRWVGKSGASSSGPLDLPVDQASRRSGIPACIHDSDENDETTAEMKGLGDVRIIICSPFSSTGCPSSCARTTERISL